MSFLAGLRIPKLGLKDFEKKHISETVKEAVPMSRTVLNLHILLFLAEFLAFLVLFPEAFR